MEDFLNRIPFCFRIFEEGENAGLNLNELKEYLQEKTTIPVYLEGKIYQKLSLEKIDLVARKLAQLRIKDPHKGSLFKSVLEGEVNYEKERLRDPNWKPYGMLYAGVLYQQLLEDFILRGLFDAKECVILITNQLIGTWDPKDWRYHIRTSLYGFPHIISIPGLVMAPARPREFYLKRQMGIPLEILKKEYHGRFLDHDDARTTEVLKGYAMQAFFYQLTDDPFCQNQDCRLFNSHWQEEMIRAQLDGSYEFCPTHEEVLNRIRNRVQSISS